jgi:hypothetical protein
MRGGSAEGHWRDLDMTMQNPSASLDVPSDKMHKRPLLRRLLDTWIERQSRAAKREIVRHLRRSGRSLDGDFRLEFERRLLGQ